MQRLLDLLGRLGDWDTTGYLLHQGFVQHAVLAVALLGLMGGLLGPFIVMRQMSFSVHGTSETALTGAAAALLFGFDVGLGAGIGSVLTALLFGLMGDRRSRRDSSIGVVMAFALGLSVLFIHLYPGRSGSSFSLLVGQVVSVSGAGLTRMAVVAAVLAVGVAVLYRPLLFASADPEVARARGVPVRLLGIVFSVMVGLAVAQAVQIVGALLVMSLLITPAAAAAAVTAAPGRAMVLSLAIAELAAVGGVVLSLAPGVPISVFVTTISFAAYVVCWVIGAVRSRRSDGSVAS